MENKKIDIDITKTDTGYMVDFNGIVIAGSYSPRNCVLKRYRTDTEKLNLQLQALNLEIINKEKKPTEEEIKKEWDEAGYEWIENDKRITITSKETFDGFRQITIAVIYKEHKKYSSSYLLDMKLHKLLTKTFKMLGWE